MLIISLGLIFFNLNLFSILRPAYKKDISDNGEHSAHEGHEQSEFNEKVPPRILNLLVPLAFLLFLIFLLWWTGRGNGLTFWQAITNADFEKSIFVATLGTLILTGIIYGVQKIPMKDIESCFLRGGTELLPPIIVLILAWSIADVTADLGFHTLIKSIFIGTLSSKLVPLIIFLIAGLASYFMGSSGELGP